MKTAVIYWTQEGNTLYVIDGDYRHLHGIFANLEQEPEQEELHEEVATFLGETPEELDQKKVTIQDFRGEIQVGAFLIECGFVL